MSVELRKMGEGQQRSRNPHGRSTFAMISANCVAGRDRGKGLPVLSARQFIGAATTALSLITGAFLLALAAGNARAQGSAPACDAAGEIAVLPSPWAPWKGAPLRVMLVTEKPLQGELSLTGPDGSVAATSRERHGGPPYFWFTEIKAPAAGSWHATLTPQQAGAGCGPITREIKVRPDKPGGPGSAAGSTWPLRNTWNRASENLFSAWIEKLFDDPLDAEPSWPALHEVVRDPSRNFLFNHLGLNEDAKIVSSSRLRRSSLHLASVLRVQDGAALRLLEVLARRRRAGRRPARNGSACRTPKRPAPAATSGRGAHPAGRERIFRGFERTGAARAAGSEADRARAVIRRIGADRLGQRPFRLGAHRARRQQHRLLSGAALSGHVAPRHRLRRSLRAHPDDRAARRANGGRSRHHSGRRRPARRHGRAQALLARQLPVRAGPRARRSGIQALPSGRGRQDGAMRRLNNAEIAKNPQYADFSLDQSRLGVEDFYDRMDDVMSPSPLDPTRAMKEAITSLDEQVKVRVTSVENGRKFQNSKRGEATMPDGPAIFETSGAWEDFSTPSRDLRLLIAIDVVRGFPDRVARRPERYAMPQGQERRGGEGRVAARARVRAGDAQVLVSAQRRLRVDAHAPRRDRPRGRRSRWRTTPTTASSCAGARRPRATRPRPASATRRRRSATKMSKYRAWFHERRRPPRA